MHIPPFLSQALIYLCAAVIALPLFKRLGLGSVLGYLVAGIAIGPFGFKLIPDVESVLQASELGVVLLLIVGSAAFIGNAPFHSQKAVT